MPQRGLLFTMNYRSTIDETVRCMCLWFASRITLSFWMFYNTGLGGFMLPREASKEKFVFKKSEPCKNQMKFKIDCW